MERAGEPGAEKESNEKARASTHFPSLCFSFFHFEG